jgi:hypothetical protein
MGNKIRTFEYPTVDEEFEWLGSLGHSGSLNDRLFSHLRSLGLEGSLTDMLAAFYGGGYTLRFLSQTETTQTFEVNVPDPHMRRVSTSQYFETYRLNPATTTFVSEDATTITVEV